MYVAIIGSPVGALCVVAASHVARPRLGRFETLSGHDVDIAKSYSRGGGLGFRVGGSGRQHRSVRAIPNTTTMCNFRQTG